MNIATLRSYRIYGIALFDVIASVIGMLIIMYFVHDHYYPELPLTNFMITGIVLTIPIGIAFHLLFGVNTTLNYYLGLSNKP